MAEAQTGATGNPVGSGDVGADGLRTVAVTFKFATASKLVIGDTIIGFPSYVKGNEPIVIDPLPQGLDRAALQAAINRRTSELATVAQALGLASSLLATAIASLDAMR